MYRDTEAPVPQMFRHLIDALTHRQKRLEVPLKSLEASNSPENITKISAAAGEWYLYENVIKTVRAMRESVVSMADLQSRYPGVTDQGFFDVVCEMENTIPENGDCTHIWDSILAKVESLFEGSDFAAECANFFLTEMNVTVSEEYVSRGFGAGSTYLHSLMVHDAERNYGFLLTPDESRQLRKPPKHTM